MSLDSRTINETIEFHGHNCPGLSIGIRVSQLALERLGRKKNDNIIAVVETDMCAVDGIQFLTGCTFGKGNLIHKDYGKVAFSFFDPEKNSAFRITLKKRCFGPEREEMRTLMKKSKSQELSDEEKKRLADLRQGQIKAVMSKNDDELFEVTVIECTPPSPAKILDSHECTCCSEMTMESRVRLLEGKSYCIPCFEQLDQKR